MSKPDPVSEMFEEMGVKVVDATPENMTNKESLREEIKKAVIKDFDNLLVKEFTADWKTQRMITRLNVDVMSLDNLENLISQEVLAAIKLLDKRQGDEHLLCDTCFGRRTSRLGGAAMTTWKCNRCNGSQSSGSTAHGSICTGCSIIYKKCRWCNHNDNKLKYTKDKQV